MPPPLSDSEIRDAWNALANTTLGPRSNVYCIVRRMDPNVVCTVVYETRTSYAQQTIGWSETVGFYPAALSGACSPASKIQRMSSLAQMLVDRLNRLSDKKVNPKGP